jgi:vesicle-fusing ATPase
MATLTLLVGYAKSGFESSDSIDTAALSKTFIQSFAGQIFLAGQSLAVDFCGTVLKVTISGFESMDLEALKSGGNSKGSMDRGVLMRETGIQFSKSGDSTIKLKGSAKRYVYF